MDNASKFVIIAGGLLVTVLVISVCMYGLTAFREMYEENMQMHTANQIAAFNMPFTVYPKEISGDIAYNIIGKVNEVNQNEDAIGSIDYSGITKDEFYFTENFENTYIYEYKLDPSDGLVYEIKITR